MTKLPAASQESRDHSFSTEEHKHENAVTLADKTIPEVTETWRKTLKARGDQKLRDSSNKALKINLQQEHETQRISFSSEQDYSLKSGTVHFQGDLILRHVQSNKEFIILNQDLQKEIVVGRLDTNSGINPTVDLTKLEIDIKAISRRHAIIHEHSGLLVIVDQNSTNGTFLNGQHLVPHQPRVLRDKDELCLGKVQLLVCFRRPTD